MSTSGGAVRGRGSRVSSGDAEVQREINKQAPRIANLGGRIRELFRPYRGQLAVIIVLVLDTLLGQLGKDLIKQSQM